MADKTPKVKTVPAPNHSPDFSINVSHRPTSPIPVAPQVSMPNRLEPSNSFARLEVGALMQESNVSANPVAFAIDELAMLSAPRSLADYRIPASTLLGDADAQGIRMYKGRQFVAVADGHFVQVVLDAGSGLLRATQARELNPSGPLLKPDGEGRFWLALDSSDSRNRLARTDSIHRRTAELVHRVGYSVDDFSEITMTRVLAVSGMDEALARDFPIHSRSLAVLQETLRRFSLDRKIQIFFTQLQHPDPLVRAQLDPQLLALLKSRKGDLAERDRALLFQDHERAFELDCDENTLQMRRSFPELTKTVAEALWQDASASDRLYVHSHSGMTRQMAEDAQLAMRDVRLARACEGIYLDSVSSLDSDRLALHMIGLLAQWPSTVRIEIRHNAKVATAVGDVQAPFLHVLVRQDAGYVIDSPEGASAKDMNDLYSSVWLRLLPVQRQALGVLDGGGQALRHLVRSQPLPSRQVVSEVLEMAPRPVSVDPAALQYAQTGGLRGGADNDPTSAKSVVDSVRELYPQLKDEEVTAFINQRLKNDPSGVMQRLEKEFAMLREELAIWSAGESSPHSQSSGWSSAPTLVEQRQAREQFSKLLQDIWQRKSISRWEYGDYHFSADVDFSGELPRLSTRFEYVTELILTAKNPGARIGPFLDSFPNVQYLMVNGVKMEDLAPGIFQMRELRQLTLNRCSLRLSEATAEGLGRIETLTLLNLSQNPLTVAPHVGFMQDLTELMLHDANLSNVPSGVGTLKELEILTLQNNNIVDVGEELFDILDTQNLFIGLVGNPLNNASRERIDQYLDRSSMDRKIEIKVEESFSDSEYESDSSESGFGTDSSSS